jgi:hypothetical protein
MAIISILLDTNAYTAFKRKQNGAVEIIRNADIIGINIVKILLIILCLHRQNPLYNTTGGTGNLDLYQFNFPSIGKNRWGFGKGIYGIVASLDVNIRLQGLDDFRSSGLVKNYHRINGFEGG